MIRRWNWWLLCSKNMNPFGEPIDVPNESEIGKRK